MIRQEDVRVKIPALIHLTRLGYRYLPRSGVSRDPETNILPDVLRAALSDINSFSLSDDSFAHLLARIQETLARGDLGKSFLEALRSSWGGIRLIDFAHPEKNRLHVMTELPYISGQNRFRPDITVFVNGLPLALVEVKSSLPKNGVASEYERMLRRARNPALRRFFNETQLMVFSNDSEYNENDLLPLQGAFYATSAYDGLTVNRFVEAEPEILSELAPADAREQTLILQDNHLEDAAETPAFLSSLSSSSPTHRLLTSLFHIRRLLFFLRYGISYLESRETDGQPRLTKQILRCPQLFALRNLEHLLRAGGSGSLFRTGGGSRATLSSAQIRYLSDYYTQRGIPVRFFYFTEEPGRAFALRDAFLAYGFRVICHSSESAFLRSGLWEDSFLSPAPLITVVDLQEGMPLPPPSGERAPLRICFYDGSAGYIPDTAFPLRLRRADPKALLIEMDRNFSVSLPA